MEGATKQAGFTAPGEIDHSRASLEPPAWTLPAEAAEGRGAWSREHVWRSSRRTRSLAILEVHHDPAAAADARALL